MKHLIIVGLGNPGSTYENTRHNIGFTVVDAIAQHFAFPKFNSKFSSLVSSKIIESYKITLVKPQTYMNLSGAALSKIANFYKVTLSDIIVLHDDLDLKLGKVKMKLAGGSAGHNGIKSIDQQLGVDYYRVRIGIGKDSHQEVSNFVLSRFSQAEDKIIQQLIMSLIKNFDLMITKNLPMFMNILAMEYQAYGV